MLQSQDSRLIRIKASFVGANSAATDFQFSESISSLFLGSLVFKSPKLGLTSKDVIGQGVTVSLYYLGEDKPRHFHARVNSMQLGDLDGEVREYRLSLVPGMWFMSQANHHRIFENKTSVDIVKEIIASYGDFCPFEMKTEASYVKREYTVQFGETDFDFVARLLAEEGISYYFTHTDAKHLLVMTDATSGYENCEEYSIAYSNGGNDASPEANIHRWQRSLNYHPDSVEMIDYNHNAPTNLYKQKMKTSNKFAQQPSKKQIEDIGAYGFMVKGEGKHDFEASHNKLVTQRRLESYESDHDQAQGCSDAVSFVAGGRFELKHPAASEEKEYILTSVEHIASDGNDQETRYENSFDCIPSNVTPRPDYKHAKNVMRGPLTAKVVELKASQSSSNVDPYRLIKVAFPWDSKYNSCWLRVVQSYAGSNWGASFVPRLDQEVLIEFIGGDPDRPLVVGALYNKDNEGPQYSVTQSGYKTASKQFNELRFDDKSGKEEIYVEAGKDYNFLIHNNQEGNIKNDQTVTIDKNRSITVAEGNETKKISKGNQNITIGGNQSTSVKGSIKTDTKDSAQLTAAKSITIKANQSIELKVGGSSIKIDPTGITLKAVKIQAKASAMADIKASGMVKIKGGITLIN